MRRVAVGIAVLLTPFASGSAAAQQKSAKEAIAPSFFSELRLGTFLQDAWGRDRTATLAGEILFAKPFTPADLFTSYFVPRPHLGGALGFGRATSYAYTGLTWTLDVTPRVFVEGSLSGVIHNGEASSLAAYFAAPERPFPGCSPAFRESGSVGVRLSANWSLIGTIERLSSGGLCAQSKGMTNFGARLGYSF